MPSDEVLEQIAIQLRASYSDLKRLDPRIDDATYSWIQETPVVAEMLRVVRERYPDPQKKIMEILEELDSDPGAEEDSRGPS